MGITADEFFAEDGKEKPVTPKKKATVIVPADAFFAEDETGKEGNEKTPSVMDIVTEDSPAYALWNLPNTSIVRQLQKGFHSLPDLIVRATGLEKLGGPVVGPEGFDWLSGEEMQKLREEGKLGVESITQEEPQNILEAGAEMAGSTLLAGPIFGKAASFVKAPAKAATISGRIAQFPKKMVAQAGEAFAKSPVKTTAVETGFGFTSGAGGYIASEIVPDSDAAKFVGELIGGILPALTPTGLALRGAAKVQDLYRIAKHPFTEIGGRQRAAARAERALGPEQRETALSRLDEETTIDPETGKPVLTPAQRIDEPGLLSLERAVMDSSEELSHLQNAQIARANTVLQQSLRGMGGDVSAAEVPVKEAIDHLDGLLETRLTIAAQKTDERIAELGPNVSREQANLVAREELEGAFDAARKQERELYDLIPDHTAVPYYNAETKLRQILRETGGPQQEDIPEVAIRYLSGETAESFSKNLPVGFSKGHTRIRDLRALQSKLRQDARNARSGTGKGKNANQARIADEIADAITEDLAQAQAGGEVADAIKVAVGFSRNMNERFNRGTIATILGRRATGGDAVPPGLTLEMSLGMSGGPKSREAFDDLLRAFDSPEAPSSRIAINATEDYIRGAFLRKSVENGQVNVKAAERFLKSHEELLTRLPNVRRQIEEVIESGEALAVAGNRRSSTRLDDPRVSKAVMLIQSGPVETFKHISRQNPDVAATEVQKLINRVNEDATGEALAGLKSGFIGFLESGAKDAARDVAGQRFLSGYAMRDMLDSPATKAMVERLFSPDERSRLDVIVKDLVRLEKRRSAALPAEGILGDKPSKAFEAFAGIVGAKLGKEYSSRFGIGGTLQSSSIFAARFRDLANAGVKDPAARLLRDAIMDETLFRELLQAAIDSETGKLPKEAVRRLHAWTAGVLAEYGETMTEDEEPQ